MCVCLCMYYIHKHAHICTWYTMHVRLNKLLDIRNGD